MNPIRMRRFVTAEIRRMRQLNLAVLKGTDKRAASQLTYIGSTR